MDWHGHDSGSTCAIKYINQIQLVLNLITDGLLRGSGAMRGFMVSIFSNLILRVALGYYSGSAVWIHWNLDVMADWLDSWNGSFALVL